MVRAHVKQPADEKKESHKKKTVVKKKAQETGVWPCKINGCNKEFAREADLKRHQRTTKVHSLPGVCVVCPQCDATFTRTDALRRHQKSRHNGVMLDPIELPPAVAADEGLKEDNGSAGSASQSRSGTPSRANNVDTAGPASAPGSGSYYRSRPNPMFAPPPEPYPPVALPTSSTRMGTTSWPPAPPWAPDANGPGPGHQPGPPPPGGMPYSLQPPAGFFPGAYYRGPNGQPVPTGGPHMQDEDPSNSNIDPNLSNPGDVDMKELGAKGPDATSFNDHAGINAAVRKALQAVLAIDPSLSAESGNSNSNTNEESGQNATLKQEPSSTGGSTRAEKSSVNKGTGQNDAHPPVNDTEAGKSVASILQAAAAASQMMTEDGEPMLRPDELLNEESLASPPPS